MILIEDWSLFWAGLGAVSTAIASLIVIFAAAFTYLQVKEAGRVRKLEATLAILEHISSPDLRNARRLVYKKHHEINEKVKSNPSWEELDAFFKDISNGKVDISSFHTYLASLENVSILVLHDLAPDEVIEMYFYKMAPRHWENLTPFIEFLRKYYDSNDFLQHFEMFNTLLAKKGLNIDKGFGTRFISQFNSAKSKRRLLTKRRDERKSDTNKNGLQHINNTELENKAKIN
jgi:Domain of unknown function (DUF4760)